MHSLSSTALADVLQDALSKQLSSDKQDGLLATLLAHIAHGVLVVDQQGGLILANTAADQILGELLRTPEIGGTRHFGYFAGPGRERLRKLPRERVLQGAEKSDVECLVRCSSHPLGIWVRITARPLTGADGTRKGVVSVIEDISKEREEKASRESSAQLYQLLFERNVAGIVRSGIDGSLVECNQAFADIIGLPSREVVREYRAADLYEDPRVREDLISALRGAGSSVREVRLRRLDGEVISVLMNVTLIEPLNNAIGGELLTTVIDITERKRWEQTLRESEERFAAFMRNLPGMAFVKDAQGRYVYVNDAAQNVMRANLTRVPNQGYVHHWPPEIAAKLQENDRVVLESGHSHEFIEVLPQEDGPHAWLVSKFPIRDSRGASLVGCIGIDITERQSLEERLQQSEKMEAIGRLAGGVAHDFNNLLTLISGYSRMALDALPTASPDQLKPYLEEVLNASSRASSLTGQLLAFSRRQVVQPRPIDMRDVVKDAERMLSRLIGEHIRLEVQTPSEPCVVHADAGQMEQVMMNIVINARDAMPDGGRLLIRVQQCGAPADRRAHRPLRDACHRGQRQGHGRSDARAPVRAILLFEGARQNDRSRAFECLRDRAAERRRDCCRKLAWPRCMLLDFSPADRGRC